MSFLTGCAKGAMIDRWVANGLIGDTQTLSECKLVKWSVTIIIAETFCCSYLTKKPLHGYLPDVSLTDENTSVMDGLG